MELNNELPQEDKELIAKIDERLKHYKLIADNEQQPPVEWKVGEWAWNSPLKGKLALIKELNGNKVNVDDKNGYSEWWQNKHILVKPTKEEIEQHLVKIAENKGFRIGTQYRWPNKPSISEEIRTVDGKLEYNAEVNAFGHNNYTIWDSKSGWAEPITEQKERWKIEVYQPNITGDEGFKIHIEPTFKLRKPLAEQAAQAIQETLKNL